MTPCDALSLSVAVASRFIGLLFFLLLFNRFYFPSLFFLLLPPLLSGIFIPPTHDALQMRIPTSRCKEGYARATQKQSFVMLGDKQGCSSRQPTASPSSRSDPSGPCQGRRATLWRLHGTSRDLSHIGSVIHLWNNLEVSTLLAPAVAAVHSVCPPACLPCGCPRPRWKQDRRRRRMRSSLVSAGAREKGPRSKPRCETRT